MFPGILYLECSMLYHGYHVYGPVSTKQNSKHYNKGTAYVENLSILRI